MFFPFMMDISEKQIVIIGGGTVALRKCELFLDFGSEILLVAPTISEAFEPLLPKIHHISDVYSKKYLRGAFAAVAATGDRAVNRRVFEDCSALNIPINVVDDPELCGFIVPAVLRRGDLSISISTGGKSPSLAGRIKRRLENEYGEEYEELLGLLGSLRQTLLSREDSVERRHVALVKASAMDIKQLKNYIKEIEGNYAK